MEGENVWGNSAVLCCSEMVIRKREIGSVATLLIIVATPRLDFETEIVFEVYFSRNVKYIKFCHGRRKAKYIDAKN